jgi:hypothetical protein
LEDLAVAYPLSEWLVVALTVGRPWLYKYYQCWIMETTAFNEILDVQCEELRFDAYSGGCHNIEAEIKTLVPGRSR